MARAECMTTPLCSLPEPHKGVVVLKDMVASVGQDGHDNGLQHRPDVMLTPPVWPGWRLKSNGRQQVITARAAPHHHGLTTPESRQQYILGSETLTTHATEDTLPTVFEHRAQVRHTFLVLSFRLHIQIDL